MDKAIRPWVSATIAGHYLALADESLEALKQRRVDRKEGRKDAFKDSLEWVDHIGREFLNLISKDQVVRIDKPPRRWDAATINLYDVPASNSVAVGTLVVVSHDEMEKGARLYSIAFIPKKGSMQITVQDLEKHDVLVPAGEAPAELLKVMAKAKAQLYAQARKGGPDPLNEDFVELTLLRRECLKYTARAKRYKLKAVRKFPVELKGWKYLDQVSQLGGDAQKKQDALRQQKQKERQQTGKSIDKIVKVFLSRVKALAVDESTSVKINTPRTPHPIELSAKRRDKGWTLYEGKGMWAGNYDTLDEIREFIQVAYVPEVPNYGPAVQHEYTDVPDFLKQKGIHEISVELLFKGHVTRGGQWSPRRRRLQIDANLKQASRAGFQHTLARAMNTLRHELQHVGQSYLQWLKGLSEPAGLPSRRVREKGVNPYGQPTQPPKRRRKPAKLPHELLDVEFHTDLGDSIERYEQLVSKLSVRDLQLLKTFRRFVGIEGPGDDRNFKTWKARNKGKWQKAVTEFIKALDKRGISIT